MYFLSQVSSTLNTAAVGKVIIKWFIAASVKSTKSRNLLEECATFRSVHIHCKHLFQPAHPKDEIVWNRMSLALFNFNFSQS